MRWQVAQCLLNSCLPARRVGFESKRRAVVVQHALAFGRQGRSKQLVGALANGFVGVALQAGGAVGVDFVAGDAVRFQLVEQQRGPFGAGDERIEHGARARPAFAREMMRPMPVRCGPTRERPVLRRPQCAAFARAIAWPTPAGYRTSDRQDRSEAARSCEGGPRRECFCRMLRLPDAQKPTSCVGAGRRSREAVRLERPARHRVVRVLGPRPARPLHESRAEWRHHCRRPGSERAQSVRRRGRRR